MRQLFAALVVAAALLPFSSLHAQATVRAFTVRAADPAVTTVSLIMPANAPRPGENRKKEPIDVTADTITFGPTGAGHGYRMETTSIRVDGDVVSFAVPARLILEDQPLDFVLRTAPNTTAVTVEATDESKSNSRVVAAATGTAVRITRRTANGEMTIAAERIRVERP